MPRFLVTPWRDGAELLRVRDWLYHRHDGHDDRRLQAVNMVTAWKRRATLPHAIDSTASLVDAVRLDEMAGTSALAVRNAYSAAFNRFVTGFCDTVQHSFRKLSMYDMAAALSMPSSFVELRHEATHEELPSLRRLRRATQHALAWLWEHYWQKLDAVVLPPKEQPKEQQRSAGDGLGAADHVCAALKAYLSARRQEIKAVGAAAAKSATSTAALQFASVLLSPQQQQKKKKSKRLPDVDALATALADVLVGERLLVPSDYAPNAPLSGAHLVWDPLLQRLRAPLPPLMHALTTRMAAALAAPSPIGTVPKEDGTMAGLLGWLLDFLSPPTSSSPSSSSTSSNNDNEDEDEDEDEGEEEAEEQYFPTASARRNARDAAMRVAMLQPGRFWCRRLARALLRAGEDEFQDAWLPVFEAAAAAEKGKAVEGGAEEGVGEGVAEAKEREREVEGKEEEEDEMVVEEGEDAMDIDAAPTAASATATAPSSPPPPASTRFRARAGWAKWQGDWHATPIGVVPS
ncbi:uncharacterized protein K452DRAFT_361058 [Aplosporella prunicola CBS 121167]|uniref:Las1-like protein n=1 Tax=Aplosporella prunicola CBS 121167 TaxID=1176127 RepID=A0A6A6B5D5_9PEZI|nr:uncharacterized protein K452DRAFT_361058 [Aplosporella prunicola CBS 121167]KAF2138848.1 hypothetical protein K452DRAFT_361058 [Aplosporella prunicola CBS 121167]